MFSIFCNESSCYCCVEDAAAPHIGIGGSSNIPVIQPPSRRRTGLENNNNNNNYGNEENRHDDDDDDIDGYHSDVDVRAVAHRRRHRHEEEEEVTGNTKFGSYNWLVCL